MSQNKGRKKTMLITIIILAVVAGICAVYFIIGLWIQSYFSQGQTITKTSNVTSFNKINSRSMGELKITQSDKDELRVQTTEKYMSHILDDSQDSALFLREKEDIVYDLFAWAFPKPTYYVSVKSLEQLSVTGAGNVDIAKLAASNIDITIKGMGQLNADLDVSDKLTVTTSGSRSVTLSGTAQNQVVDVTGTSKYEGRKLITQTTAIGVSGSGRANVNAEKTLDVTINGGGKITYTGNPQISRKGNAANRLEIAK